LKPRWWSYLFVHRDTHTLIGVGGYRGNPSPDGSVEIRFSIAPTYRRRGYTQEAAQILITHAFSYGEVRTVFAYTPAKKNALASILEKCSMIPVKEFYSLDDSKIWKWEINKPTKRRRPIKAISDLRHSSINPKKAKPVKS
jgi:RimJ/RimL family protein N-acetyltransferase